MKHGFDGEKIWRPIELTLSVVGIAFFTLGLNWFVRIDTDNKIEISELFELETRVYPIENIKNISHNDVYITDKGTIVNTDHYVIEMEDKYKWSSYVYRFFAMQKDRNAIIEKMDLLSKKTGLNILEIKSKDMSDKTIEVQKTL